jgi:hypothetical protein
LFEITEDGENKFCLEVVRRFRKLAESATNQTQDMLLGSEMDAILELKVLADVGLVGFQMLENQCYSDINKTKLLITRLQL